MSLATCPYCGSIAHQSVGQCPRIKTIEYHPDGTTKRVELHPPQPEPVRTPIFYDGKLIGYH